MFIYSIKLLPSVLVLVSLLTFSSAFAATVSCTSSNTNEWVPSKGYAEIWDDGINASNSHVVRQYLYWRTSTRLTWFANTPTSTYEPDVLFYNYDRNGTFGYAPLGYWASDLPSPYVDTQAFDSENEMAVTIGSANAQNIQPGKFYNTVTRMTWVSGPNSIGTKVKLSSQRGRRVPAGCYSTNCSFGCDNGSNIFTVPFQAGFTAPGNREWWYLDPTSSNQPWY